MKGEHDYTTPHTDPIGLLLDIGRGKPVTYFRLYRALRHYEERKGAKEAVERAIDIVGDPKGFGLNFSSRLAKSYLIYFFGSAFCQSGEEVYKNGIEHYSNSSDGDTCRLASRMLEALGKVNERRPWKEVKRNLFNENAIDDI